MGSRPAVDFSSPWPLKIAIWVALGTALVASATPAFAQQQAPAPACSRPAAGSTVAEPEDLRSHNGVLSVELIYRQSVDTNGATHYCYIAPDGSEAPTLRVKPGDLLILRLKNEIPADPPASLQSNASAARTPRPAKA